MSNIDRALPIALLHAREATLKPFRRELDEAGLTVQQWRVIRVLSEGKACCATELAKRCVLMPPSLTRILRTLTARGFIEPVQDSDRRRKKVQITPLGRQTYDKMSKRSENIYDSLDQKFGHEKMVELLRLLDELHEVAVAA